MKSFFYIEFAMLEKLILQARLQINICKQRVDFAIYLIPWLVSARILSYMKLLQVLWWRKIMQIILDIKKIGTYKKFWSYPWVGNSKYYNFLSKLQAWILWFLFLFLSFQNLIPMCSWKSLWNLLNLMLQRDVHLNISSDLNFNYTMEKSLETYWE